MSVRTFRQIIDDRFDVVNELVSCRVKGVGLYRLLQSFPEVVEIAGASDHVINLNLGGDYQVERHRDGGLEYRIGSPGTTTILPSGHSAGWRSSGFVDVFQVYFDAQWLCDFVEREWDVDAKQLAINEVIDSDDTFMKMTAKLVLEELSQSKGFQNLVLDGFALAFAGHLIRRYSSHSTKLSSSEPVVRSSGESKKLRQAMSFIRESLEDDIRVRDVALHVGLPLTRLNQLFKSGTGVTPHQYIIRERIALAQSMMADPQPSLASIALRCGFSSQSHMSDLFRDKVGVSPGNYRKQIGD